MIDKEEMLRKEFEDFARKDPVLSKIRLMRNKVKPDKYFYDQIDEAFDKWKKENNK